MVGKPNHLIPHLFRHCSVSFYSGNTGLDYITRSVSHSRPKVMFCSTCELGQMWNISGGGGGKEHVTDSLVAKPKILSSPRQEGFVVSAIGKDPTLEKATA